MIDRKPVSACSPTVLEIKRGRSGIMLSFDSSMWAELVTLLRSGFEEQSSIHQNQPQ